MLQMPQMTGLTSTLLNCEDQLSTIRSVGHVTKLVGLTLESFGPIASFGDLVSVRTGLGNGREQYAEVVGFRDNRVLLMPLDGIDGVRSDDRVVLVNHGFRIAVGMSLLGRVLDGLGRPIDDGPPLVAEAYWPVRRSAPASMRRQRIETRYHTGVRAIDAVLTCGQGQRVGIFAGSGVGKSTLLGMISRNASSDINVIALIGERGKEVREFIEDSLGPEGLARSVVVIVTSDKPPLQRVKGAETAMAIAEYFRAQGRNVTFIMDSVTRYAMAQREIGLAVGEPPATRGYPPSVFSMLASLLERAGTDEFGSITALFTVLVEADDMNDPIGDAVRGILDGHIVLSRDLAARGHYPAIDVLSSVSRVMTSVADTAACKLAQQLRELLAVYNKAEDMITIGAYQPGSNARIDRAIAKKDALDQFLCQDVGDAVGEAETLQMLAEILST